MSLKNREYKPLVSIVIPVYNGSNYLKEAIDSALGQTYSNIEIIVVNDGSKDDGKTRAIAMEYEDEIRYIEKENGGSSSALNVGIQNMNGEWFSWLSHDDLYDVHKIKEQIDYINTLDIRESEIESQVLFSAAILIDSQRKIIRPFNEKKAIGIRNYVHEKSMKNEYFISEPTKFNFHGCSCLVHRKVFDKIGGFDESLKLINDVDMWFRIYSNGYNIHYIAKPLVYGRIHSQQISRNIGFSYHNPEQEMFWERSYRWLMDNFENNEELFYLYGKNAYSKTRFEDGDKAFDYLKEVRNRNNIILTSMKLKYKFLAYIRMILKQIYIKIKM